MQKLSNSTSRIFRPRNAAAFLGIGKTTLYSLVRSGELPAPLKLGLRASGWQEQTLLDFIARRITNAPSYDEYKAAVASGMNQQELLEFIGNRHSKNAS